MESCSLRGLCVRFVETAQWWQRQEQLWLAKKIARACSSAPVLLISSRFANASFGLMRLLVSYGTLAALSISRRARIIRTVVADLGFICVAVGSPTASLQSLLLCPRSGGTVVAAHAQAH